MTTKDLLCWEDIGGGVALAAGWFKVGNDQLWIDFISSGAGGKWKVSANNFPKNHAPNGMGTRVTFSMPNCFRHQAADKALAELLAILKTSGADRRRRSSSSESTPARKAVAPRRAQALLDPATGEPERKWRRWAKKTILFAERREANRAANGGIAVPVTMTIDGTMAKLRRANYRCALSGLELRNDGPDRVGPTIPSIDRLDCDGPYSDDNTRIVLLGVSDLRGRGSEADMYRIAAAIVANQAERNGGSNVVPYKNDAHSRSGPGRCSSCGERLDAAA